MNDPKNRDIAAFDPAYGTANKVCIAWGCERITYQRKFLLLWKVTEGNPDHFFQKSLIRIFKTHWFIQFKSSKKTAGTFINIVDKKKP